MTTSEQLSKYSTTSSSSSSFYVFEKTRYHNHYEAKSSKTIQECWDTCWKSATCKAITYASKYSACFFYNTESPEKSVDNDFTSISKKKQRNNKNLRSSIYLSVFA